MTMSAVLWADGPLVAFDLETTGLDTTADRIVTATVVSIIPGQQPKNISWLADPGVDIPQQANAVHGVSTQHAREHGTNAATVVAEIVDALAAVWLPEVPLCAFNAAFDLSLLAAELRRHHSRDLTLAGPVVDPMCIDRQVDRYRKGSRTLAAACAHYQVRLDDAHSSAGDALAAARLAWRLAKRYPDQVGAVNLAELHDNQRFWYGEQQHNFAAYLDRLADQATDPAEASQLRHRAAATRSAAKKWPLQSEITDC